MSILENFIALEDELLFSVASFLRNDSVEGLFSSVNLICDTQAFLRGNPAGPPEGVTSFTLASDLHDQATPALRELISSQLDEMARAAYYVSTLEQKVNLVRSATWESPEQLNHFRTLYRHDYVGLNFANSNANIWMPHQLSIDITANDMNGID